MTGGGRGRRRAAVGWVVALLALGLGGCAGFGGPGAQGQWACWPRFPYQQGWLGGDGAYSVALSPTRSVWLFGDTFVGRPEARDRVGAALVHNAVGVSECRGGRFAIEYAWRRGADGAPRAFLERPGDGWWWLFGGFVHGGALYVGLLEVERSAPRGPLGIPFAYGGSALARVANPGDPPARWRVELLPLVRGAVAHPVSAFAVAPPHLYLFGFLDLPDGRHPRILARLPLAALTARAPDPGRALETWTDAGWAAGWRPEAARIVMDDNASEMSVRHDPESGAWVALYNFPDLSGAFPQTRPSDAVVVRTAPAPEGPWSPPRPVFRIPELAPGAGDPHLGCYAAKEQPQFSRPGSLTFTYVCNLFAGADADPFAVLGRLQRSMDLYRPRAATVTLPEPLPGARTGAGTLDPAGGRD